MPANSRVFLKPFIGGLNTEGSDTDDMVLNTSDELNCTILPEQMRGRRYGFNIEKDGKWIDSNATNDLTGSVYYWKNVAKTDLDILVCRIGDVLYFFDAAVKPISDSTPLGTVSLKDYIVDDNQFYKEKFGFAVGDGKLTVVNRWMQPVRIIYNVDPDTNEDERFVVESFTLSVRDIEGVIDSWGIKSSQQLVDEGNDEPQKDVTDPTWTITNSSISKVYIPYCDKDGDCYLKRKRTGLSDRYLEGPLTKSTVGSETHVFYEGNDIGVFQSGDDVYGGSKEHFYNLLNQGWTIQDLENFKTAMETDGKDFIWPDNSMAVSIGRDNTGAYNTGDVVYTYLGNTHQPRGHFILDYFKMNRSEVSGIYDFNNAATAEYSFQHTWVHSRSIEGEMINNHSTTVENSNGIVNKVVLKWTKLYRKNGKKSYDLHWRGNIEIKIYGLLKDKWTLITTRNTFSTNGASSESPFVHTVEISGGSTEYEKYKVDVKYYNGNGTSDYPQPLGVTVKIAVYTSDVDSGDYFNKQQDSSKITDVAYMSGKYFYLCKDSVLFSQTVKEDGTGFDLCYQDADPTSTEVSDIVTTDGGYVKFNTMGRGVALKTFNRGVLVFGRDVVYGLISPLESRFTATDYDILELSRAGLISPESVVSTTQQVYYWSPTGIYTIGVNPETGSTIFAQSISLNTIQTFYNNLPQFSKEHCKGVFDYTTNRIYWYYPTDEKYLNNFDGCLVYDITYNSFMPQKISQDLLYNSGFLEHLLLDVTEVSQSYEIEPTFYLRAGGLRVVAGDNKVLVSDETSTDFHKWTSIQHLIAKRVEDSYKFSIGDFNDREFHDWEFKDYSSYVVSRPITLGDTYFNKQTPVMQTLFKRTEEHKLNARKSNTVIYSLNNVFEQLTAGERFTNTYLFNAGKIIKAHITFDFANYSQPDIIHVVRGQVFGYDDDPLDTTLVASATEYPDINGGKYKLDLDILPAADRVFKHYNINAQAGGQLGTTMDRVISTVATIEFDKADEAEPIFKGFKEVVYNGSMKLDKYNTTRFSAYVDTPEGFLKSASVTYRPSIVQYFDPIPGVDTTWTASAGFVPYASPVAITNASPTATASYSSHVLYNRFGMLLDNLVITGPGVLYNDTVFGDYTFSILIPDYENFTDIIPFDYTTPSGAIIRMRWGWSINPLSNRWDMMQNGYRPQKDFLHDDYVESRLHIRGRGKAFQVEIRNDFNKDFRLTGLNIITRSPQ